MKNYKFAKKMFLQTLCLGEYSVQDWIKQRDLGMTSSTEINKQKKTPSFRADKEAEKEYLTEFLSVYLNYHRTMLVPGLQNCTWKPQ